MRSAGPRRLLATAAALGVALALAGCGSATSSIAAGDPASAAGPTRSPDPTASGTVGTATTGKTTAGTPEVLRFRARTVDGAEFDGASLAGKPVVLWFWAPWCTICRGEAPDVAAIAKEFGGRVQFVGIAGLGPVSDMQQFVSQTKTGGFTHLADVDGSIWNRFGIAAQPAFVFIRADGSDKSFLGGLGADDLRNMANKLAS